MGTGRTSNRWDMKPFRLSKQKQRQAQIRDQRKEALKNRQTDALMRVLRTLMERAADGLDTGRFPDLDEALVRRQVERFYYEVVVEGISESRREGRVKNLAKPVLPRTLRDLEKMFRDRRGWPLSLIHI